MFFTEYSDLNFLYFTVFSSCIFFAVYVGALNAPPMAERVKIDPTCFYIL